MAKWTIKVPLTKERRKEELDNISGANIKDGEGSELIEPASTKKDTATDIVRQIKKGRGQT